jgi:predicted 3-demethylubiquinone-9 3-methyltransferase (glyoxalase superfamily)
MSKITPCLWFDGKAEEAARFYVSLLPDSRIDVVVPYSVKTAGGAPGDVMAVEFTLAGQHDLALNGGPVFQFTPAISFAIACADQAEVDRLWNALTDGGAPDRCGWLKDRYGVSWQIVSSEVIAMAKRRDTVKVRRMTEVMMQMVKLDIAALRSAFEGEAA